MKTSTRKLIRDYGGAIALAVAVAFGIRVFVLEAYRIPSASMRPTLEAGDTIFVTKWQFTLHQLFDRKLERGAVVVFSLPLTKKDYIKRVIALSGDTVEIRRGSVILNGRTLEVIKSQKETCGEERLPDGSSYGVCWEPPLPPLIDKFGPETIPEGSVFVIGDFRGDFRGDLRGDSTKSWGIIPVTSIKGIAKWIWLSIEPSSIDRSSGWFPHFRFERMFRRIQ